MADAPLPAGGPEKAIYLRALRAYSDNCETPELTPGCPFFVMGEKGPECSEECLDELAKHGEEALSPDVRVINLDHGLALVRGPHRTRPARARRRPDSSGRPFDVGQIVRSDADRPVEQRRTAALVSALLYATILPPWIHPSAEERIYGIRSASGELVARGLDVEGLIRYVIAPAMGPSLAMNVALAGDGHAPSADPRWLELVISTVGPPGPSLANWDIRPLAQGMAWWARQASLEDITNWTPPAAFPPDDPGRDAPRALKAKWILDRFTETYMDGWATSSLHHEWLYQDGRMTGPCNSTVMSEIPIDRERLAALLAERKTKQWLDSGGQESVGRREFRTEDFTSAAVENIRAGRLDVALGIFEGCANLSPDDAIAHHNYGFCLIPRDPKLAYESLERARRNGYKSELLNATDRVLALHLAGRNEEARQLALETIDAGHPPAGAYLWEHPAPEPRLAEVDDIHAYLNTLLGHLDEPCPGLAEPTS